MLWSAMATTAAIMRAKEDADLTNKPDAEVIALFQTEAKTQMLFDLQRALKFEAETDDSFEAALTTNATRLQEALACKQLYLFYSANPGGPDSATRVKMSRYDKLYSHYQNDFPAMYLSPMQGYSTKAMRR